MGLGDFGVEHGMRLHCSPDIPALGAHDAAKEIPECALQVLFIYLDDEGVVINGVVVDAASKSEEIAHGVNAKTLYCEKWIHDITGRLGHLLPTEGPMAVCKDLTREGNVKGHEKGWPVDAVKSRKD